MAKTAKIDFGKYGITPEKSTAINFAKYGISPEKPSILSMQNVRNNLADIGNQAGAIDQGAARFGGNLMADVGRYGRGPIAQAIGRGGQLALASANNPRVYGNANPTAADSILSSVAQSAPYALLPGGISRAGLAGAGAAYGLTQNPNGNPLISGAEDAGANMVMPDAMNLAGKTLKGVGNYGLDLLQGYAIPGIQKGITGSIDKFRKLTNQDAFDTAAKNYETAHAQNEANWNALKTHVQGLDKQGVPFGNGQYQKYLSDRINDLSAESLGQVGSTQRIQPVLDELNGLKKSNSNSWEAALKHRKNINGQISDQYLSGTNIPKPDLLKTELGGAKNAFDDQINTNLSNSNDPTTGLLWANANASHNHMMSTFSEMSPRTQNLRASSFIKSLRNPSGYKDTTDFVRDYLPATGQEGTGKISQLGAMLGDQNYANAVIKRNLFRDSIKGNRLNLDAFSNKFNNLSEDQHNMLFEPQDLQRLKALNMLQSASRSPIHDALTHVALSAGLGSLVGYHGGDVATGTALGAALTPATNMALEKVMSIPKVTGAVINRATGAGTGGGSPLTNAFLQSLKQPVRLTALPAINNMAANNNGGIS